VEGRARAQARGKPSLVISVPSENSFLGIVRDVAKRMAEIAGFDEATAGKVALAVDEAAANVIEHAYRVRPDREVEVRIEDRGPDLEVEVVDHGARFDPNALPHFELERYVNERRKGGLGIHLMGKIMDSVTFRRSAHKNICSLVKHKVSEPGS